MRAGGHDDIAGVPGVGIGDYTDRVQAATRGGDLHNAGVRDDGRLEGGGVLFEMLDQLSTSGSHRDRVRWRSTSQAAGSSSSGEQVQGVPAFERQRSATRTPIEYDVIASGIGQQPAHGEPGVARAHDEGVNAHHEDGCR